MILTDQVQSLQDVQISIPAKYVYRAVTQKQAGKMARNITMQISEAAVHATN